MRVSPCRYQALLPVLKSEGVYASLCAPGEATCSAQELRLDLMFTITMSAVNAVGLGVGFVIPRIGPARCCMVGSVIIACGAALLAFSASVDALCIAGYVLMGAGGPFIAFPMFTLPQLIPARLGLAFSLIIGAFDGSAAMMIIVKVLHDHADASLRMIFLLFLILPAALFLSASWLFRPAAEVLSEIAMRNARQLTTKGGAGRNGSAKVGCACA